VIVDLQSQLNSLQGGNRLETRVFPYTLNLTIGETEFPIDLNEITGYDLPSAIIKVVDLDDYTFFDQVSFNYKCDNIIEKGFFEYLNGVLQFYNTNIYLDDNNCRLENLSVSNDSFNRTLMLAITTQFPSESPTQQSQTTSKQSK